MPDSSSGDALKSAGLPGLARIADLFGSGGKSEKKKPEPQKAPPKSAPRKSGGKKQ